MEKLTLTMYKNIWYVLSMFPWFLWIISLTDRNYIIFYFRFNRSWKILSFRELSKQTLLINSVTLSLDGIGLRSYSHAPTNAILRTQVRYVGHRKHCVVCFHIYSWFIHFLHSQLHLLKALSAYSQLFMYFCSFIKSRSVFHVPGNHFAPDSFYSSNVLTMSNIYDGAFLRKYS